MSKAWERMRRALSGSAASNTHGFPAGPIVAADHAAFLSKRKVSEVVQSSELLAETLLHAYRLYQGDFLIVFADVYVEAEAMGCELAFPDQAPPEVISYCQPEHLRLTDPGSDGRLPIMVEAVRQVAQELTDEVAVFASIKDPFSAATLACDPDDFLSSLISEPDRAHQAIGIALENQKRYAEALVQTGANFVIGAPMASGSLIGPRHFSDFVLRPMHELVETALRHRVYMGVHVCGDSDPILDQLADLPVNFLSLERFDTDRWRKLAAAMKTRTAIMGYFPTDLLIKGTREEISREVNRETETLRGLPHVMATACDVPQACPPEKVQWFMTAARGVKS